MNPPSKEDIQPAGETSSLKKLILATKAKKWMKDVDHPHCAICRINFKDSMWQRVFSSHEDGDDEVVHVEQGVEMQRHHCRCCGEVVCNLCSLFHVIYTDKKIERTCLHCVVKFEIKNISDENLKKIESQVRSGLGGSDNTIRGRDLKNRIESILNLTDHEKQFLRMEVLMDNLTQEMQDPAFLSASFSLSEFTSRFFLYPYLMKRYQTQILHIRRDVKSFHKDKYVSFDAMRRGFVYTHSQATLRMFQCVVDNDLPGLREAIAQGANLHHRVHLACSNISILDLKRNLLDGIADENSAKAESLLDWRWVNFYNVRDFANHSSAINWDAISIPREKKTRRSWPFGRVNDDANEVRRATISPKKLQTVKDEDEMSAIDPIEDAEHDSYFRESVLGGHEMLLQEVIASEEMVKLNEENGEVNDESLSQQTSREQCSMKSDEIQLSPVPSVSYASASSESIHLTGVTLSPNTTKRHVFRTESKYLPLDGDLGNTALHFAVACRNLDIVRELLTNQQMRKKITSRNEEGYSPYRIAQLLYPRTLDLFRTNTSSEKDLLQLLIDGK